MSNLMRPSKWEQDNTEIVRRVSKPDTMTDVTSKMYMGRLVPSQKRKEKEVQFVQPFKAVRGCPVGCGQGTWAVFKKNKKLICSQKQPSLIRK